MWPSVIGYTRILARLAPYHPLNNLWNWGKRTQKFISLHGICHELMIMTKGSGKSPPCILKTWYPLPTTQYKKVPINLKISHSLLYFPLQYPHWAHQLWGSIRSARVIFPQLPASSLSNFSLTCMTSFSDTFPISFSLYITYSDLLHVQNSVYSVKPQKCLSCKIWSK